MMPVVAAAVARPILFAVMMNLPFLAPGALASLSATEMDRLLATEARRKE